jgi:asparagine synthase (glutamine-hydrolysing)
MVAASGRYVIIYNGEIYNHADLRSELQAAGASPNWRGHSDTETLLAGIENWGVGATLSRTIGMFALALWDRRERTLTLARDRLGEKPLYYGWQNRSGRSALLFGSELKALAEHPAFEGEVCRDALALYMRRGYVPAPLSIYRGIRKLGPGTCLTFSAGNPDGVEQAYWSAEEVAAKGIGNPLEVSESEAVDGLEALLKDAVGRQLMSDVPLGAFLSGGIDSSTIVSLMQAQSNRPVRTFTIGFTEGGFNEAEHARAVAAHLGTHHTELYLSPGEALDVIPRLPSIYDEPFADSSQIPTFLVSQLARRDVIVALSGDAGDEVFGGYDRYDLAHRMWRRIGAIPAPLRRAAGAAIRSMPRSAWNRIGRAAGVRSRHRSAGDTIYRGARLLGTSSAAELGLAIGDRWADGVAIGAAAPIPGYPIPDLGRSPIDAMMASDMVSYLPDDILAKVDRAAMAVSLETRVPFLDHRVVEYAWRLPLPLKWRPGRGKWIVRELLARHVPRALIERPKMGFSVPIAEWLRGPLKDWAEHLLDPTRLRQQGFLRPEPIRYAWHLHQRGDANMQAELWAALMFQAWLGEWQAGAQ